MIGLLLFILLACPGRDSLAHAQSAPDPRAAQPERPTVATHAWTVAPRYVELETGVEWDHLKDDAYLVFTPTVLKIGVGARAQLGVTGGLNAASGLSLGVGDVGVVLKYRVADSLPVLGAFALLPGIKFPTGGDGHGTNTTDTSLVLISSRQIGAVALDVNVGYIRRSGNGIDVNIPRSSTVWTVSTGGPIAGVVGFAAEVFGYPGTRASLALLTGPVITVRPWAVLDAGAIIRVHGDLPNAVYAGLVYNFGRF